MIRINLLKEEVIKEKGVKRAPVVARKPVEAAAGTAAPGSGIGNLAFVLSLILLFLGLLGCVGSYMMQRIKINSLKKTIVLRNNDFANKSRMQQTLLALNQRKEKINQRINTIQQLNQGRYKVVSILQEINTCLPSQIWLTELKQTGKNTIDFKGVAVTNLTIPDFMARLEASLMFSNVQLVESKKIDIEGKNLREFTVQAIIDQF